MKRLLSIFFTGLILGEGIAFAQADPFPEVNYNAFMGNMIVVAEVMENGVTLTENVVIAAYAGDEIRGKASVSQGSASIFMMVCGETSGETLHFAVSTDGTSIQQLEQETFTYRYNGQLGTAENPCIVTVNGLTLADAYDNSGTIAAHDGQTSDVTLAGRTLYKNGNWNTLCLPFNLTLSGSILSDADVRTLSSTSFDSTTGVLTLDFTEKGNVTELMAGSPYIIRWVKSDPSDPDPDNLVNPVFSGVTISKATNNVTTTCVDFIGTTSPVGIYTEAHDNLFLGSGNTLYYPNVEGYKVNACRAYFHLHLGGGSGANAIRAFVLNFGDGETGISTTNYTNFTNSDGVWYDLSGRKFEGAPTEKGIYIVNGKKMIVK